METFSALLALCVGNSSVTGEFLAQRPLTRSYDVFFDLRLNNRLSKQSWGWLFETPSCSLWHHCHDFANTIFKCIFLRVVCRMLISNFAGVCSRGFSYQWAIFVWWKGLVHRCVTRLKLVNTLRPRQMSQTTFSNAFSWMKMFEFRLKFHWSLFPRVQLKVFQQWFR